MNPGLSPELDPTIDNTLLPQPKELHREMQNGIALGRGTGIGPWDCRVGRGASQTEGLGRNCEGTGISSQKMMKGKDTDDCEKGIQGQWPGQRQNQPVWRRRLSSIWQLQEWCPAVLSIMRTLSSRAVDPHMLLVGFL